jgi:type IV pilus assembly protein PilA
MNFISLHSLNESINCLNCEERLTGYEYFSHSKNSGHYKAHAKYLEAHMKRSGFSLIELMIVVALVGILTAVTVPAYREYVMRVRVANGLTLAAAAQTAVAESTTINNALPATAAETGYVGPNPTKDVAAISIADDGTAIITITYTAALGGGTILLVPSMDVTGTMTWNCQGGTIPNKYRPAICRT